MEFQIIDKAEIARAGQGMDVVGFDPSGFCFEYDVE